MDLKIKILKDRSGNLEAQFYNSSFGRRYGFALYSGDFRPYKLKNDGNLHSCKPEVIGEDKESIRHFKLEERD